VDLRPHLRPAVEDDLGYDVGLSQALHRVDPAADPLALAVAVRRDLVRDLAHGVPTKFHAVAELLFRVLRRGRTPSALADSVSTATCHDGTLHWTFTALAPVVDAARAKRLVDDTARRLTAMG